MSDSLSDIARILVQEHPRRQLERLVGALLIQLGAVGAAVLVPGPDGLKAVVTIDVPVRLLSGAEDIVASHRPEARLHTWRVGPLTFIGVEELGVIVLVDARGGVSDCGGWLTYIRIALQELSNDAATPAPPISGAVLMAHLESNEWNVARVARLLRVTRRTIYMRMRRWKIERRRVPRHLAPDTARAAKGRQ